jgi:tetratricopeptide (TPR) repeat protein
MKTLIKHLNQNLQSRLFLLFLILFSTITFTSAQDLPTGIKIFEAGNYYGAQKFFTDFLQKNPDNATANYYLGRIAWVNKNNDKASDYFEKATDMDQTNTWFYTWKGINYITLIQQVEFIKQGLYAYKALSALETAVGLDSMNALARTYLAGYYSQAPSFAGGSEEKAIEQINLAVAIDSTDMGIQVQRGIIMSTFKQYPDAKRSFEKCMEIDHEFYPAYYQMGRMCADAGLYLEQGEVCLSRFIQNAPKDFDNDRDDAWWLLGNIYMKKGNNTQAREAYEKAVSLNPDNEDYRKSLKSVM